MTDVRELLNLLTLVERNYTRLLNRGFQNAGFNLSREQYELLQVLWEKENVNQQFIARSLNKDKYNVTKLLNTLQKRGFIQRKAGKEDKRNNFIVLTDKGRESEAALSRVEEQVHTEISFMLSTQEIKSMVWMLKKMNIE